MDAAINTLQTILGPRYVQLDGEAIRRLPKMGEKSVAFVEDALEAAKDNPDTLPADFSVAEFDKALVVNKQMSRIDLRLEQITTGVSNMAILSGSSAMSRANQAYGFFQIGARTKAALKAVVERLSERYKRAKKEQGDK